MSCADRKITIRITRRHEHIIELIKYRDDLKTTDLCNKIIKSTMQKLINLSKEKAESGYDYNRAFANASTVVLNQLLEVKRALLSFRLTIANEELIFNHFMYYTNDGIKNACKDDLNKIASAMIADYLDNENFSELCKNASISEDEVFHWIQKDKKPVKYK